MTSVANANEGMNRVCEEIYRNFSSTYLLNLWRVLRSSVVRFIVSKLEGFINK